MASNGGPFKMVYGYGGTSEIMAAFDRGELDMTNRCGPSTAGRLFPEWAEEGRLVPVVRFADKISLWKISAVFKSLGKLAKE